MTRHGRVFRVLTGCFAASLIGSGLTLFATEGPAAAANAVTFKVSNADIYDNGYNQSYTSVLTATETGGGTPNIPTISAVAPGTLGTSFSNGFYCGAPTTQTATTASCTIEAAPGFGDDTEVIGGSGTSNTVSVADTDNSNENGSGNPYTGTETMIIYPAPVCGVAPDSGGTLSGTNDTIYSATSGANNGAIAEACFDGADTNPAGVGTGPSYDNFERSFLAVDGRQCSHPGFEQHLRRGVNDLHRFQRHRCRRRNRPHHRGRPGLQLDRWRG